MNTEYLAPVIAIVNQKGGIGKTTTTVNLAAEVVRLGCSVLVVDLDPQGNASNHIGGIDFGSLSNNVARLICDPSTRRDFQKIVDCVHKSNNDGFDGVFYIPSAMQLDKLVMETVICRSPRPDEELKIRLDQIRHLFDLILIDCPPSLTTLTNNAISAATHYIAPIDTGTEYSTSGWIGLMEHVENTASITNPGLSFLGALLTRHDATKNINKAIAMSLEALERVVLPIYIHTSTIVGNASLAKTTLRKVARGNKVTKDYENLADYIMNKLSLRKSLNEENNEDGNDDSQE